MKIREGTARRTAGFLGIVSLALLIYILPSLAVSFNAYETNQPTLLAASLRTLSIAVNNTNTTTNISTVVITLPSTFTYVENSNATTAFNTNFTNTSGTNLTWSNNTLQGIINATQTAYFNFSTYLPPSKGSYNITVTTYDNTSVVNATTVTIIIFGLASTSGNFSSYQEAVRFNWSGSTLTLEANVNGTQLFVDNLQTAINPVYFTPNDYPAGSYLSSGQREQCFNVIDGFGLEFSALNTSPGIAGFPNRTLVLNKTNTSAFTLHTSTPFCPPGLYRGTFAVRNISNTTDAISIPATISIPISRNNTFSTSNNSGTFNGNGSVSITSFSFFTNITSNITAVTVNVSVSNDADIFLLSEDGTLLERSIETGSSSEEMSRFLPSQGQVWEIRLANILQSFTGFLYATTLNITTTTGNVSVRNLTIGQRPLSPNETSSAAFRLVNEDQRTVDNVWQTTELAHTQHFLNYNTSRRFDIFVPSYATKLKIMLVWDNESGIASDWDMILRDSTGSFISNSTNKSAAANSTDIAREELIVYTGPFTTSNEGLWNITVINQSSDAALNLYNLTVMLSINETAWVNTSFNQSTNFNLSGTANSSRNITVTVTAPRTEVLNGSYNGFLVYHNNSGWKLKLPFTFQLNAGHLFINNNLSASTVSRKENVGYNRTLFFNVTFNNTGGFPIYFNSTTSGNAVFLASNMSKYANFTVDNLPSNPILPGTGGTINITVTVDSRAISQTTGIYSGWLFFNTTNTTINASSYPYPTFNLTLQLNLTTELNTTMTRIITDNANPVLVGNTSKQNNITMYLAVRLLNMSVLSRNNGVNDVLTIGDFYNPVLKEQNTSTTYTLTTLRKAFPANNLCDYPAANICSLNATVPASVTGGRYTVFLNVRWNTSETNLTGTAFNTSLMVNNTGLNMSAPQSLSLGNVNELAATYFNATVGNLGYRKATGAQFTLNAGSCPVTISRETSGVFSSGCSAVSSSGSGATFSATINPFTPIEGGCALRWKLTAQNVSSDTSCTLNVTADHASFNNITGITLTVKNTASSSSTSTTTSSSTTTPTSCSADSDCASTESCIASSCTALSCASYEYITSHACVAYALDITSYDANISALLGGSAVTTVAVMETNNKTVTAELNVSISSDITTTVTPSSCTVPCSFTVTLNTTNATTVRTYNGSFTAVMPTFASDVRDTATFSFSALPTAAGKQAMQQQYTDMLPTVTALQQQFALIKESLSEGNRTLIQALVNTMNNISAKIQAALDAGDYITANALLSELNDTVSQIQNKFTEVGAATVLGDVTLWIAAGAVLVGVALLLLYLFLPQQTGFSRGSGFRRPRKGIPDRLRGRFRKKQTPYTIARYAKGYEKHRPFSYKKSKGSSGAIKKFLFKKKQRKLRDYSS